MKRRLLTTVAGLAIATAACNTTPAELGDDTTTTTLAAPAATSTTSVTLPPEAETEVGAVESITDGDSLGVSLDGRVVEVRLLGVNAPEAEACYGSEARAELAALVTGREVVLVAGEEDTDDHGRLLRFVLVDEDGELLLVNAELVAAGSAIALQNGHEQEQEFKALEDRAYASGKGMWGTFVCSDAEGEAAPDRPQLRIGGLAYDPPGEDGNDLDNEWIEIVNESYATVNVSGWTVRDESSSNRFSIPTGTSLNPGSTLRIITGCGDDTATDLHWCSDLAVWSNGGDTVIIQDQLGNVVERWPYRDEG